MQAGEGAFSDGRQAELGSDGYERIRQIGNFDAKPYMEGQGEEIQEKRQEALQVLLQL